MWVSSALWLDSPWKFVNQVNSLIIYFKLIVWYFFLLIRSIFFVSVSDSEVRKLIALRGCKYQDIIRRCGPCETLVVWKRIKFEMGLPDQCSGVCIIMKWGMLQKTFLDAKNIEKKRPDKPINWKFYEDMKKVNRWKFLHNSFILLNHSLIKFCEVTEN